jgi:tetratricopeptide (TPR) repeat protein
LLARAFEIRQQLQSAPSDESVATANAPGYALYMKGDWDGAEQSYADALAAAEALHSGDHPLVSEALNGGALVALERGEFAAAERQFNVALAMDRRLHGAETHADIGRTLWGLARALLFQQRFDESEVAYREALAIRQQTLDGDHPLGRRTDTTTPPTNVPEPGALLLFSTGALLLLVRRRSAARLAAR